VRVLAASNLALKFALELAALLSRWLEPAS
jgi:hypothetical protein